MGGIYVGHSVADYPQFGVPRRPCAGTAYERDVCGRCGAAVWVQHENAAGRAIICWRCRLQPTSTAITPAGSDAGAPPQTARPRQSRNGLNRS
jgi:hypothetical protein